MVVSSTLRRTAEIEEYSRCLLKAHFTETQKQQDEGLHVNEGIVPSDLTDKIKFYRQCYLEI